MLAATDEATVVTVPIGDWTHARAEFCARVESTRGTLKILLKTKDDPYLLEPWIHHHARIVGFENLIIFDNMSSNEQVQRIYTQYQSQVAIARFEGHHDIWHDVRQSSQLYDALRSSCRFFVFLDTDELLVALAPDRHSEDGSLIEHLDAHSNADLLPATAIPGVVSSRRRFTIGTDFHQLGLGLAWGKPILRSAAELSGFINQNVQVPKRLVGDVIHPGFFVLHLKNLIAQQRIDANINKLIARGFAAPGETIESITARAPSIDAIGDVAERSVLRLWVNELRQLNARVNGSTTSRGSLPRGCIELLDDGRILFHGEAERRVLKSFLCDSQPFLRAVLHTDQRELLESPASVYARWNAAAPYRTWNVSTRARRWWQRLRDA